MTLASRWLTVWTGLLESRTFTVNFEKPLGTKGVPERTPPVDIERPLGRAPAIENVYGGVPYAATIDAP